MLTSLPIMRNLHTNKYTYSESTVRPRRFGKHKHKDIHYKSFIDCNVPLPYEGSQPAVVIDVEWPYTS